MEKLNQIQDEVNKIIKGKNDVVQKVLAAILAGGHILMEDIPGVGKTTLATTFAKTLSMNYKRVQFTPDVLPSDILGFSMYNSQTKEFEFKKGPIFCNFFLADEINRTSPKTQSALLEVMEEGNVTIDGNTRELPTPFVVIATENPYGSSGTQMLPESQLDRFMICLSMGYPAHEDAIEILKGKHMSNVNKVEEVLSLVDLEEVKKKTEEVFVHDEIFEYVTTLTEETRSHELFAAGASPRGAIALLKMSKAMAVLNDRDFVTAQDVQSVCKEVLGHRVKISSKARMEGMNVYDAIDKLIKDVKLPRN